MKGAESGSSLGSALRFEVGIGTDDFSPDNGVGGYCLVQGNLIVLLSIEMDALVTR